MTFCIFLLLESELNQEKKHSVSLPRLLGKPSNQNLFLWKHSALFLKKDNGNLLNSAYVLKLLLYLQLLHFIFFHIFLLFKILNVFFLFFFTVCVLLLFVCI